MKIELKDKMGVAKRVAGSIKTYKKNAGDLTLACVAAAHYAHKLNKPIAVVPGNCYGRFIWHLAQLEDDIRSITVVSGPHRVAIVYPNGDVFEAEAI